jgi:Na+/proline symporter
MTNEGAFTTLDYVIFALMLAISAGIGIFYGFFNKKQQTSKETLLANREMGVLPASLSLLASFMSGITILGNPSEVYLYGTMFWWSGKILSHFFKKRYLKNYKRSFVP